MITNSKVIEIFCIKTQKVFVSIGGMVFGE